MAVVYLFYVKNRERQSSTKRRVGFSLRKGVTTDIYGTLSLGGVSKKGSLMNKLFFNHQAGADVIVLGNVLQFCSVRKP
jgi:hypothetical protein